MTPRPTAALVHVGIDVGGTKTHVHADSSSGRRETVRGSDVWRRGPLFDDPENLVRLADLVRSLGTLTPQTTVAAGIHDCDTDEQMATATTLLREAMGCHVEVVNDAQLLRYATEERRTIEMIVGTGAIVSGTTADGDRVTADGYGWPVGDRGSAPDLVHAGVLATLTAADRGDLDSDPLYPAMRDAFGAADAAELALHARHDLDPARWGAHAPRVFEAWHAGSPAAHEIVTSRAHALATGVALVKQRGATASLVVAGGGVIAHQPRYEAALRDHLTAVVPDVRLHVVRTPPAAGALALAREIASVPQH